MVKTFGRLLPVEWTVQSHGRIIIISLHRVHLTNSLDIERIFSDVKVMTPPLKGL